MILFAPPEACRNAADFASHASSGVGDTLHRSANDLLTMGVGLSHHAHC